MKDNDDDDDNFFDFKPLNTSKRALNTNPPFFGDTLYIVAMFNVRIKRHLSISLLN